MSISIPNNRVDPTGTSTLRKRYAQKLRASFSEINTAIRDGIIQDDVFGLQIDALAEPPNKDFRFLSDPRKRERFEEWLKNAIDEGPLEVIQRGENTYIRSAYQRGLQDAQDALRQAGFDVPDENIEDIFNQGVHRQSLDSLYTRNFELLEGITAEMSNQIGEELAAGFAAGENPRKIARRITDRVDKIGKTRATTLARTEIINAHNEANLNRFEDMGVGRVTIQAEFLTAQDDRVCPLCASLEGRQETYSIQEAREGTWEPTREEINRFIPAETNPDQFLGEFSLSPPIHPNCRCRWLPVTS